MDRDGVGLAQVLATAFDVIFVTYFELAEQLLPAISACAPAAKLVIDSVDLHYLRALRQGEIEGDPTAPAVRDDPPSRA